MTTSTLDNNMPVTREQVASAAMPPTKSWQRMVELPAAEHLLCGHAISIKSLVEAVEASAVDAKNGDAQSREQDPVLRSTASARLLDELQCCEPCLRRYRQELTGGDGTATPLADNPMDSATTATHLDDAYPEFERRRLLHAIAKIPTARANIPSAKKSAGVAERNAFQRTISEMWRRPWVLRRFPDVHDLFAERFVGYLRALGCALTPSADASDSGTVGTILLFPLHRDVFVRTWGKRLVSKLPEARKGEPLVRAVHVLALRALWDDVMQWLEYHLNQLLRPNDQHTPPNDNCFPLTPIKENFLTGFVDVEKLFDGTVWPTIAQSHPSVVKLAVELALSALPEAEQWRVIAARIYCEVGTACFFEVTQSSADAFLEAALGTAMLNVLSQDMKKRLLTALHNDHPTLGVSVANSAAGTKTSSAAMMRTRFGRLLTALKQIKADKTVTDVIRRITDLAVEATVSGNIESASGWISLCATDLIYHNTDRMDDAIYKNLVDIVVHDVDAVKSVFAAVEPLVEAALGGKPSKTTSTPSIHVCSSLWQTLDAQNGMPSTDAAIIVINAYTTLVTLDCKLLTQYIKRAAAQNKNVADEALLTTVQRLLFIFNQLSTFIKNLGKIDLNADVSHFFRRILHSTSPGDTTSVITRTAIPGLYAMLVSSLTEYRKSAMVFFARSGQDRIATAADVYAMTLRDYTAESLRAYFALVALVTPKMLATDWGMKLGCRVAFMGADCAVFLFGADERHTSNAVLKKMGDVERNATLHRFFHTTWKLFMLVTPLAARSEGVDSKMAEGLSVALARILETSKVLVGVYTSSSELLSLLTLRENVDNKSVLFPQPATWFDTLLKALQQVRHRPAIVDLFCTCLNATTKCGVKLGEEELTELSSLVNGSTLDSELKKTLVAGIITTNNMALMNCIGANDAGSSGATGMAEQALTDEQLAELIWGDTEMQEMNETEEVTPTMEDMNITSPQSPDQLLPQTPVEEEPIVAKEEPTAASVVASAVSVDAESSDSLNRLRELLLRKKNAMGSDVAENAKPTKMAKVRAHDSSSESENEQKQDTTTAGFSKLLDDCSPKKVQPVAIPADDGASRKMSVSSISREMDALHAEILNWDYWRMSDEEHRLCALRKQLPRTFSTSDEYREGMAVREENDLHLLHTVEPVTAFKPLIIAECHAELMRNFEEMSQGTAKLLSMMVTNAQPGASFVHVQMNVDTSQSAFATLSENDILVMTPESPSSTDVNRCFELPRGMSKSSSKDTRSAKPFVAFALVKSIAMRYSSVASVQIRIHLNRGKMFRTRSNWTGLRVGSAATINREYRAMATVEELKAPLRNEILNNTTMRRQLAQIDDVTVASIMSAYRLNRSQAVAVGRATRTSDGFVLIQGPPGTGKTKTILGCIGALLSAEGTLIAMPGAKQPPRYRERVLVCAPSNAAVDELVRRVRRGIYDSSGVLFYPKVVRLGTIDAASDSVRELTLDQLVDTAIIDDADLSFSMREAASSKIVTVQQELVALKSLLESKYAELLSTDDEAPVENEIRMLALQRQRLMDQFIREAQTHEKTRRHFDRAKTGLRSKILNEANIVLCTLSMSGHENLAADFAHTFPTVLIDEACQSVELSTLIPLQYGASRCILVGDPNQLPPTVLSQNAKEFSYEQSLFVRQMNNNRGSITMLDTQYRMHPEISRFPSTIFYDSKLQNALEVVERASAPWHKHARNEFPPYCFFDVASGREDQSAIGQSLYNNDEVLAAVQLYDRLCSEFPDVMFAGKVSIITPYREQKSLLAREFMKRFGREVLQCVQISTIDGAQAQEADIVIMSCVRANNARSVGFLADQRRLNVGLTRAKHSMFILGHSRSLSGNECWLQLIKDAKARGVYRNVTLPLYGHVFAESFPPNALLWTGMKRPVDVSTTASPILLQSTKRSSSVSPCDLPPKKLIKLGEDIAGSKTGEQSTDTKMDLDRNPDLKNDLDSNTGPTKELDRNTDSKMDLDRITDSKKDVDLSTQAKKDLDRSTHTNTHPKLELDSKVNMSLEELRAVREALEKSSAPSSDKKDSIVRSQQPSSDKPSITERLSFGTSKQREPSITERLSFGGNKSQGPRITERLSFSTSKQQEPSIRVHFHNSNAPEAQRAGSAGSASIHDRLSHGDGGRFHGAGGDHHRQRYAPHDERHVSTYDRDNRRIGDTAYDNRDRRGRDQHQSRPDPRSISPQLLYHKDKQIVVTDNTIKVEYRNPLFTESHHSPVPPPAQMPYRNVSPATRYNPEQSSPRGPGDPFLRCEFCARKNLPSEHWANQCPNHPKHRPDRRSPPNRPHQGSRAPYERRG